MRDTSARSRTRHLWREWVHPILVVVLLLLSVRSAVADWNDVPSGSMEPTLLVGDRIFVNRLAYDLKVPFTTVHLARWDDPERGDVVVLLSPVDGRRLVKRVVGIPGDVVEVRGHRLRINGVSAGYGPPDPSDRAEWVAEGIPAALVARETVAGRSHPVMAGSFEGPGSELAARPVPPGMYFLMGDHRDVSYDSRFWGFAERRAILGRVEGIAVSVDYERYLAPRWQRFFTALDQ